MLERRAREVSRDLAPKEVVNLMWAYAMLGRAPGTATWEALERRVGEVLRDDMDAQNCATLTQAFETLGRADALERLVYDVARDMNVKGVVNLMCTYAKLGRGPGAATWEALDRRAGEVARDMLPHEMAKLMQSYGQLERAPGAATWEALDRRTLDIVRDMDAQDVACVVFAYLKFKGRMPYQRAWDMLEQRAKEFI